jgi:hypothetical protein
MSHRSPWLMAVACAAVSLVAFGSARPARAADWRSTMLDPAVRSWMAVLTLVTEDAPTAEHEKEQGDHEDRGRRGREEGRRGPDRREHAGREQGGPPPAGPRMDALGKLDEILGRLRHIESMLAARPQGPGPRGPGAGPRPGPSYGPRRDGFRGPPGAGMPPEARERMEARAKEARERWDSMTPEQRAEMRKNMEARMQAARERMREGGRRDRPEGEARSERPRSPGEESARPAERAHDQQPGADQLRNLMRASRERFAAMQQRIERLEAEVKRLTKKLEERDDD